MKKRELAIYVALMLGAASSAFAQDAAGEAMPAEEASPAPEGGDASATAAPAESTDAADSGDKKISAALLLGFGLTLNDSKTGGANIYGLGFGVRGGYKVTPDIYVGARFMYFLGESNDITIPGAPPLVPPMTISTSINEMQLGLEGGYDVTLADKLVVRPLLGLGLGITSADPGNSETDLYISLGGALHYDVADAIYVGGDLEIPILFANETVLGLQILATAGMRF